MKQKKMLAKRLLSLALSMLLVLGLMPVQSLYAAHRSEEGYVAAITREGETTYYETLGQAAAAVAEGETIDIFENVTIGQEETVAFAAFAYLAVGEGKSIICNGTVTIGGSNGIIFENALYYHGGEADEDWELKVTHVPTYWTAGEGYAIFCPSTEEKEAELTLYNATIYSEMSSSDDAAVECYENLCLRFSGTSTLTANSHTCSQVFCFYHDTTMIGIGEDAVLNLQGNDNEESDVWGSSFQNLTVQSGTLNVFSGDSGNSSVGLQIYGKLTVAEGARVNAYGGNAVTGYSTGLLCGDLTVDGTVNASGGSHGTEVMSGLSGGIMGTGNLSVDGKGTVNALAVYLDTNTFCFNYRVYGKANLEYDLLLLDPLAGTENEGMITYSFTLPEGSELTVGENATLDLSELSAESFELSGKLINEGTIRFGADYALDDAPEGGTVMIGQKSYTWDSSEERWRCNTEESHFGGTATCYCGPTCEICGKEYGQGDPALHVPENGACAVCDARLVPALLRYKSLSLNGDIAIHYYMDLSEEVLADEAAYMEFRKADGSVIRIPVGDGVAEKRNGESYYVFTIPVTSKEMTDEVQCQFFWSTGSTPVYTYSVKTYVDNLLSSTEDQRLKTLLISMLHYGGAAQTYFAYHTDCLANESLDPADYSEVHMEGFEVEKGQATEQLCFLGASLALNSKTSLRFVFRAENSLQEFSASMNGQQLQWQQQGNYITVSVEGICAKDLDEFFIIKVCDGVESLSIPYSPMTYCQNIQNSTQELHTPELKTLVNALYVYNQAANAYFDLAESN